MIRKIYCDVLRMLQLGTMIDMVKTLVSTCYVTKAIAIPALLEAISNGHEELVKFLVLEAKTPTTEFCSKSTMKNPLHVAAENGHENILNFRQFLLLMNA